MASLKEIRGRIGSVKGTLKITSAMRLISSAKLHSAQVAVGNLVPYESAVQDILMSLRGCEGASEVLKPYVTMGTGACTAVILITSNQTLCGAFNINIMKAFEKEGFDKENTVVYAVGKFGMKHAEKLGYSVVDCCDISAHPDYDKTVALSQTFVDGFLNGKYARVVMVYSHFESPVSQPIRVEDYLPFALPATEKSDAHNMDADDYIVEPGQKELLRLMLPMVLCLKLHTVMLDSTAAEHGARTMAMQLASENAEDLIAELSLQYNKLRQQAITSEILDLLGGQAGNN